MERSIPKESSESIDFYLRTIYSVLRSKSDTRISVFEEAHRGMDSVLHHDARSNVPDFNAFIYGLLRMPSCMLHVEKIILGQNIRMFIQQGYSDIESWTEVSAKARRRFCLYNGSDTLACFITSRSDIDDIVPVLTAFQIEWNKIHLLLTDISIEYLQKISPENSDKFKKISEIILSPVEDLKRLQNVWGQEMDDWMQEIKKHSSDLRIRLLDSSLVQYARSTNSWLKNILVECPDIQQKSIYFISSNTHCIANMLSGYALHKEQELVEFMNESDNGTFFNEWELIEKKKLSASRENLLYYMLKKYQQTNQGEYTIQEQKDYEKKSGIYRVPSIQIFDVEAQIIDLSKIDLQNIDPRIQTEHIEALKKSNAFLFNIDYPLGMTAFNILSKLSEEFENICGIYIMGKAASLNGVHGDVIIPSVVHDMHSENTYFFQNAFSGADIEPWLVYGSILDNQRAVSVFGTYLQNRQFMDALYRGGFTDIEMEGGPYLSAVYEMIRATRHPTDEIVAFYNMKFDLGILHYVSDTPMSKGKNLGAGALSYFGMDSTYAAAIAILRRIMSLEIQKYL
jgi:hypothetical protein